MKWLKEKLRKWLGVQYNQDQIIYLRGKYNILENRTSDIFEMGIDVHFKSPHMILIFSRVNGGQIRHIDIDIKDFRELQKITEELKYRYGLREKEPFWDTPPQLSNLHKY